MELTATKVFAIALIAVIALSTTVLMFFPNLLRPQSLMSVSRVTIDPQGYESSTTGEWRGSFWMINMITDFDDQIAGFHLAANEGEPAETYAETITGGKTYAEAYTVDGNLLVPTADVMVHVTPQQPYYERPLEIQQGYYIEKTYATKTDYAYTNRRKDPSNYIERQEFIHYNFGSGSWVLHTPFKVDLYKDGDLIASQTIDTVGGTGVYRIPSTGEEFINILDLGKINTGYGEPQWDDVLYFSDNHIFVRSPTADNILRYDSGVDYDGSTGNPGYLPSYLNSFSTYWFGTCRWYDDSSPAAFKSPGLSIVNDGDFRGWDRTGTYTVSPVAPDVFGDVIPYLQSRGIQKVSMPTGFKYLEKVDRVEDGENKNYLRVFMDYEAYSSLITIKISTELADTIVWQPQVGGFEITSFPDFGDIADSRFNTLTVKCIGGAGTATVRFYKEPNDLPLAITPTMGTPRLETGESYTLDFDVLNLGTPESRDGSITAKVSNSLGEVTDTATATLTLLKKTGASTIVHVTTEYEGEPVSDLAVTILYAGDSQTKTTGLDGLGVATFNLGTSADVTVTANFGGNSVYRAATETQKVSGGSESTITLKLYKVDEAVPEEFDWLFWLAMSLIVLAIVAVAVAYWRWS